MRTTYYGHRGGWVLPSFTSNKNARDRECMWMWHTYVPTCKVTKATNMHTACHHTIVYTCELKLQRQTRQQT